MEIGAHLPLIPFSAGAPSLAGLQAHAAAASRLGYRWLSANDHLVFRRPWLDGLTALAAVLDASGDLGLATTVCLPAVRGPAQAAKAFAALDLLSGGRFVGGTGPRLLRARLRRRRGAGRGAVRAVRGGGPGAPGPARPGPRALRRPLLPDRRRGAGTASGRAWASADLARRVGRLTWAAARGGAGGRLARLGLQHHPGGLRDLVGRRAAARGRPRRRPGPLLQRHRHPLGVRHRGPPRGRARAGRRPRPAPGTDRGVAARSLAADRPRGGLRAAAERLRRRGRPAGLLLAARRRGPPAGASRRAGGAAHPGATPAPGRLSR